MPMLHLAGKLFESGFEVVLIAMILLIVFPAG